MGAWPIGVPGGYPLLSTVYGTVPRHPSMQVPIRFKLSLGCVTFVYGSHIRVLGGYMPYATWLCILALLMARCTDARDVLRSLAILRRLWPWSLRVFTLSMSTVGLLPQVLLCFFLWAAIPDFTLSLIIDASNSAKAPIIWSMRRPALVERSTWSRREMNAMLISDRCSSIVTRSFKERAKRSSFQTSMASNLWDWAACSMAWSWGRLVCVPVMFSS